jgi:hypothetical protein
MDCGAALRPFGLVKNQNSNYDIAFPGLFPSKSLSMPQDCVDSTYPKLAYDGDTADGDIFAIFGTLFSARATAPGLLETQCALTSST